MSGDLPERRPLLPAAVPPFAALWLAGEVKSDRWVRAVLAVRQAGRED